MFKTKRNAVMVLTDLLLVTCLVFLIGFVIPNPIRDQSHVHYFTYGKLPFLGETPKQDIPQGRNRTSYRIH